MSIRGFSIFRPTQPQEIKKCRGLQIFADLSIFTSTGEWTRTITPRGNLILNQARLPIPPHRRGAPEVYRIAPQTGKVSSLLKRLYFPGSVYRSLTFLPACPRHDRVELVNHSTTVADAIVPIGNTGSLPQSHAG